MKYHEMTKNYIFREVECGLSVEEATELCLKSVRKNKEWDKGKEIPKECRSACYRIRKNGEDFVWTLINLSYPRGSL